MKTEIIYFSATGTTKAIVTAISKGLDGKVHFTDITLPDERKDVTTVDSDLVIIAIPVYGERIPHFLFDYIKQLQGNGTPLAAVSVYGNMGFGISLEQFKNFAEMNNFRLIAAGAFIGQHTYISKEAPVAYGRPDGQDIQQAELFAEISENKCFRCYACVKVCPKAARTARLRLPVFRTIFFHAGMKRKENQTFL